MADGAGENLPGTYKAFIATFAEIGRMAATVGPNEWIDANGVLPYRRYTVVQER